MNISKTQFINFSRCPRFTALYFQKEAQKLALFNAKSEEEQVKDLQDIEKNSKRLEILEETGIDVDGDDNNNNVKEITNKVLTIHKEKLQNIYDDIEELAAEAISKKYEGTVISSRDTKTQKFFKRDYKNHTFYCFVDVYQEDNDKIRIFEVKASTDSNFYRKDNNNIPLNYYKLNGDTWTFSNNLAKKDKTYFLNKLQNRFGSDKIGAQLFDVRFQKFVIDENIKKLNIQKPIEYYLVVLNSKYIFDGTYENNKPKYNLSELFRFISVNNGFKHINSLFMSKLNTTINNINNPNKNPTTLGSFCQRTSKARKCEFLEQCFIDKGVPEVNSVFAFDDYHHGFKSYKVIDNKIIEEEHTVYELIDNHITKIPGFPNGFDLNARQKIQKDVVNSRDNTPYVDKDMLRFGLNKLKYPIYHLDFETFNSPLPRFKGERCYQQHPFQFSLHIEKSPGICDENKDNTSFLSVNNNVDERLALAKKLVSAIKDDGGTILAYYCSFERDRINELTEVEGLSKMEKEALEKFPSRIFDLMDIVKTNKNIVTDEDKEHGLVPPDYGDAYAFYDKNQNGRYSIKLVLPVLTSVSYENMTIGNGTEAMAAYNAFDKLTPNEVNTVRDKLLEYCKQDTYAMVAILRKLRELAK